MELVVGTLDLNRGWKLPAEELVVRERGFDHSVPRPLTGGRLAFRMMGERRSRGSDGCSVYDSVIAGGGAEGLGGGVAAHLPEQREFLDRRTPFC